MNRKLVFSFYVNENYNDEINTIHFRCIGHFKNCFDCADITFILEDKVTCMVYARQAEQRFLDIFIGKNIQFSFIDNNEFRESKVFYDKIATRLKDEELVFFAHNKGISNVFKHDRAQIYQWVTAMYYFSLNYPEEMQKRLVNEKYYCYGSFLTKNDEPERCNKYGWYYIGTFFWINGKKLYQYMRNNEIDLPVMGDRFYDEEFLGNILQTWPLVMTASRRNKYLVNCGDFYNYATDYTKIAYEEDIEDFNAFCKDIVL